ncbi:MAG: YheU family protein [Proteobacteria bacterium]|nr:YheU family protein [Pseudomonadota bacterium]MBU4372781.1 YheU family protein [Pseudomonadota bacterium]
MSVHKIPVNKISPEALQGVIEEFISRNGTDYGEIEASQETKFRRVKQKLETGSAVLIFDDETETTNIFLADDPVFRKLDALTRNQKEKDISG